jgi:hypothetical protein
LLPPPLLLLLLPLLLGLMLLPSQATLRSPAVVLRWLHRQAGMHSWGSHVGLTGPVLLLLEPVVHESAQHSTAWDGMHTDNTAQGVTW